MYDIADTERPRPTRTELATWPPPAREAVWVWDTRSGDITWNEGLSVFFGHRIANNRTSYSWWFDLIHPDDRARVREAAERAIQGDAGLRVLYRLRCGDGNYAEVVASATIVREKDGSVYRVFGAIVDVTHQRRTAEAARTSEALFSAAFHAGPVPSIITSVERLTIIDVNEAFTRTFHWTRSEAIGATVEDLGLWVDDGERLSYRAEVLRTSRTRDVQATLRDAAGGLHDMRLSSSMVEIDGERCEITAGFDVTERTRAEQAHRASEEAYRTIVNTTLEGVWLLALDGRTSFVNPRMAQMLGYGPEEMVGRTALDFVPDEAHDQVFQYLRRLKPEQPLTADLKLLRKDGTELSATVAATVVTDDRGEPMGRLGMVTDTTERRHLEDQLRHAQRLEAVGRLAGGIAHDFNNLLTVINGYSHIILEQLSPSDPLREDVATIEEAGKRASDLTRQLLTFSRKQLLTPQVVQLDAVVTSMTKMMLRLVGEDVRLDVDLRGDGALVKVDPGQLEQVIANLVVNARDAMPDGGTLCVTTQTITGAEALRRDALRTERGNRTRVGALKEDARYVVLSIQDEGAGMAPSVRGKIFEPFFTTKKETQGTGLGLSTVYGIMMQSCGSITVDSAVDSGTSMEVYFPVEQGCAARPEQPATPSERGRGESVLVVEDEVSVRKLVDSTLRRAGYRVVAVANAGEALMVLEDRAEAFDLLLTDVVLPGVSGRRLAERLLKTRPELRVLFMSGYTEDHVLQRGICESRSAFIAKPFAPDAIARRVREVLDAPVREAGLPTSQED